MEKSGWKCIVVFSLFVLTFGIISAQLIPNQDFPKGNIMNITNESFTEHNSNQPVEQNIIKSSMRTLASSVNTITIIWPEPGYYYITDEMLLWIMTKNPSTCTYSFNSGPEVGMIGNETNKTDHSEFIPGLVDNMASDEPYFVDFYCDDGSGVITDYTYFWINTSELDKYVLRANQGKWNYLSSEQAWYAEYEGLLDVYLAYYRNGENDVYDKIGILIFSNKTSLDNFKKNLTDEYSSNLSVQVIGGKNFYTFYDEGKFLGWSSGNYFILNRVYSYGNSTPVDLSTPNDIINPYLEKYPNDLRIGTCGDGKVNIYNLDGKKEECDKNQESISCGINIGECKPGVKIRKCNTDCTWQAYGACNATTAKTEVCYDNKDNDCDGIIDENCERFLILSPNRSFYNTTNILLSVNGTYNFSKLGYSDNPETYFKFNLLCSNCKNYSGLKTFKEGNHTLIANGTLANGTKIINHTKFVVDTKKPQFSTIKPSSLKYTNGSDFFIKYSEENCNNLILNVNGSDIKTISCKSGKSINESFFQNLSKYNNQTVYYKFKMIDKAGNAYESRTTNIKVDTKSPEIKNLKVEKSLIGTYIIFNMTILNEDKYSLYKIEYLDNLSSSTINPTWKSLCTSLKPGNICYKKVYSKAGNHNIIIRARDDAGNSDSKIVNLKI